MKFISLLTDFGLKDNFVGVMKGVIWGINPNVHIVDITHQVEPQNIVEAAFLLLGSYRYFPQGTIHLVVVDPGVGTKRKAIIVKTQNYYFIAPDNGLLSLALKNEKIDKIMQITKERYFLKPVSHTFQGRDIFAPIAAHLAKGVKIENFGQNINKIKELELPQLKITSKELVGQIVYIDHFGNLITNIKKEDLEDFLGRNKFKMVIKDKTIDKVSSSYEEAKPNVPLAIVDSFGYLEIAMNRKSAKDYLKAAKGTPVKVIKWES